MFGKLLEKRNTDNEDRESQWTNWLKGREDNDYYSALYNNVYITCVNELSNTVAKLPISIRKSGDNGEIEATEHYLYEKLRLRPNNNMSMFDLIKTVIIMKKHYGCGGIYINRGRNGLIEGLYPVKISQITIDDVGLIKSTKKNKILVDFYCGDNAGQCFDDNIIILRDFTLNGMDFKCLGKLGADVIDTSTQAQKYQNSIFSNGLTNKLVIQYAGDIQDDKAMRKMQDKFDKLYRSNGRIFNIPVGFKVEPISIKLADSQFKELKTDSKRDICSLIGVPFNLMEKGYLTDDERVSYLVNSIQPIITLLEQEFDYKLLTQADRQKGYKIRFNVNAMLRGSLEQQSKIIETYIKNGVYTINDSRDILGMPHVEGGDTPLFASGQVTLKQLIEGNVSYANKQVDITGDKGGEDDAK